MAHEDVVFILSWEIFVRDVVIHFLGFKFDRLEKQCYWTRMQLTRIRSIVHLWFKEKRTESGNAKRNA